MYRIILVPCLISCPANSPCPAMRDGPTRTRIFTSGCLLVCADVLPVLLSLDSSAPNIETPTGPCTAFPGGVDHGGYRVGWLRSQARVQPPHAPLASGLGILLLSLPAHSGSIHLFTRYICSLCSTDRMEERRLCNPSVGNSTRASPLVSMPPCERHPYRITLPCRRRAGSQPLERQVCQWLPP